MKIFRAVGLGLVILILQTSMSTVFHSFENALIQFFGTMQSVFEIVETQTATISILSL